MRERCERLLCVKSIVTLSLTAIFCVLALRERVDASQFLTTFSIVISFYFGTQHERGTRIRRGSAVESMPNAVLPQTFP